MHFPAAVIQIILCRWLLGRAAAAERFHFLHIPVQKCLLRKTARLKWVSCFILRSSQCWHFPSSMLLSAPVENQKISTWQTPAIALKLQVIWSLFWKSLDVLQYNEQMFQYIKFEGLCFQSPTPLCNTAECTMSDRENVLIYFCLEQHPKSGILNNVYLIDVAWQLPVVLTWTDIPKPQGCWSLSLTVSSSSAVIV